MTTTGTRKITPWAAVAANVRRELKARREQLGIPTDATVRVTSDSFAGGAAVDVDIRGADTWAWRTATDTDQSVIQGYTRPGDQILTADVRTTGAAIAEIIRAARDAADVGYIWGGVTHAGTIIGTVARKGWTPGQD